VLRWDSIPAIDAAAPWLDELIRVLMLEPIIKIGQGALQFYPSRQSC
jgi:hypothetical protein